MDIFLYIILFLLVSCILINPKMRCLSIIYTQFKVLRNNRTNKISIKDVFCFYVFPIIISLILVLYFEIHLSVLVIDNLITVYSVVFSLLFGVATILVTRNETNSFSKTVNKETIITCLNGVLVCFLILVVLLLMNVMNVENETLCNTFNITLFSLMIVSFNYLLMILKRFFILISENHS